MIQCRAFSQWRSAMQVISVLVLVLVASLFYCLLPTSQVWAFSIANLFEENNKNAPREIHRLHVKSYINAVAWNMDGSRLAALSDGGSTITLWETKTWTVLNEFHRYSGAYAGNSLAFLPDGTLLTAAPIGDYSGDPRYANTPLTDSRYKSQEIFSLIRWNPETGKIVGYIPDLGYPPTDLSVKIDGLAKARLFCNALN